MINAKALVIAAISIIASLASLVFITAYYDIVGWLGLWGYSAIMIAIFGSWILLMGRVGIEKNPLKVMDFAIIAMFAALIRVVDYGGMFAPGAVFIYTVFPQAASALLTWFPLGIVIAAALKLSPKPGSAFTLILVEGVIAKVLFFNPVWFIRDIIAALGIEAYFISSERETMSSMLLMGLMFGIMQSCAASIFMTYTWGFWRPLFITFPAAILSGIMMTVGSFLGFALGERSKTVMY
jgi:hypothetical protein